MTAPRTDSTPRSVLYDLVEAKVGEPLDRLLLARRAEGKSFQEIAVELSTRAEKVLTHEVVRRWIRNLEQAAGQEPSVLSGHEHHSLGGFSETPEAA